MEEQLTTLWGRCRLLDVSRLERGALGWLQSGCLRLYRLGLLFPWTLPAGTDLVALHGRARAVAWRQDLLSCDAELPLAERAAHAAGLLGCYVVQTDGEFVTRGLRVAWELLHGGGEGRMRLPGRSAGVCRLLCECAYFTGDAECLGLAKGLVTEALGRSGSLDGEELLEWLDALRLYADVSDGGGDGETGATLERERLEEALRRLGARASRVEDALLEAAARDDDAMDEISLCRAFAIVAGRLLAACVAAEGKKI